ncbi:hypothetical protein GF360_00790 [candidate division WWE3 bacterium]|nr:hypothetical protein [candidate division WWE3 bacterium]
MTTEKKIESLKEILEEIFGYLGIDPKFTIDDVEEDHLFVKIWDGDLSFLIGYRGNCLKALKYFLGLALNRGIDEEEWTRVSVDIEGYLERRKEKIEEIARNHIDRVRFFGHEVSLPNMDASERFIVHEYVGEYADIESESEGSGYSRHVVLKPVGDSESSSE